MTPTDRLCRFCSQPFWAKRKDSTVCTQDACQKARKSEINAAQRAKAKGEQAPKRTEPVTARPVVTVADEIRDVMRSAAERVDPDMQSNAEDLFFPRLSQVKAALEAGEHAATRVALVDLIESAATWAAKIDSGAGLDRQLPGPRWPKPRTATPDRPPAPVVPSKPKTEATERDSYIAALRAHVDALSPTEALDRLERLLGLGT